MNANIKRFVVYRNKIRQVQAELTRREEVEVIDLLSASEDEEVPVAVLTKKTPQKVNKAKKVPTVQVNDEVLGEDGQGVFRSTSHLAKLLTKRNPPPTVYLPAPLPKQRLAPRRSPRLQGMAPEHVGLDFEGKLLEILFTLIE
jgi:hypothetical protein